MILNDARALFPGSAGPVSRGPATFQTPRCPNGARLLLPASCGELRIICR